MDGHLTQTSLIKWVFGITTEARSGESNMESLEGGGEPQKLLGDRVWPTPDTIRPAHRRRDRGVAVTVLLIVPGPRSRQPVSVPEF